MGGACRETYRLTKNWRVLLRRRTWKYNKALLVKDNLAWIVCALVGHRVYNASFLHEKPEHACSRCGQWLQHLDPTDWKEHTQIGQTPSPFDALSKRIRK